MRQKRLGYDWYNGYDGYDGRDEDPATLGADDPKCDEFGRATGGSGNSWGRRGRGGWRAKASGPTRGSAPASRATGPASPTGSAIAIPGVHYRHLKIVVRAVVSPGATASVTRCHDLEDLVSAPRRCGVSTSMTWCHDLVNVVLRPVSSGVTGSVVHCHKVRRAESRVSRAAATTPVTWCQHLGIVVSPPS